jgi:hypothetical protein
MTPPKPPSENKEERERESESAKQTHAGDDIFHIEFVRFAFSYTPHRPETEDRFLT